MTAIPRSLCRGAWAVLRLVPLVGCLASVGCVSSCLFSGDRPSVQPVGMISATWQPQVATTTDSVNGGARLTGVLGRLYLFGPDGGAPVAGDGTLLVSLYLDDTPDGKPLLKEQWKLDNATLNKLMRKDTIGWGYTLFLPWQTYHESICHIQMGVCYTPKHGLPLYAPNTPVMLQHTSRPVPERVKLDTPRAAP